MWQIIPTRGAFILKINWNRKYNTIAVYTLIVIAIAALFVVFLINFKDVKLVFSKFSGVVAPAVIGIIIAYILNPLMTYIENKFFRRLKEQKPAEQNIVMRKLHDSSVGDSLVVKQLEKHSASMEKKMRRQKVLARVLSLSITFILVFAVLIGIIVAVAPSFVGSIMDLAKKMPDYLTQVEDWVNQVFEDNPQIAELISAEVKNFSDLINEIAKQLEPIAGDIVNNVSGWLVNFLGSLITGLKNSLIGIIIAIYLLYSKERMLAQAKKIMIAMFKINTCKTLFSGFAKSNNIFKKYIISNLLDAMIIFVFMLIGTFAMGLPYQTLIAVVCGVTNLIPFFGPFIGAIPCGMLILLVDPVKVIWFGIFVLVLQQIDGNVIKPFLFGESIGLPAIWVLISITVGGGLFGIPGMLLGAPVFAVFYLLFAEFIAGKLKKKSLPDETEAYIAGFDAFSEEYFNRSEPQPEPASVKQGSPVPPQKNAQQTDKKPNPRPQKKQNYHKK